MFITFEGIEGSGKTTQLRHAADHLRRRGREILVTREPGGTAAGGKIRAVLLDPGSADLHPLTELLLYLADRNQHVRTVIEPGLREGRAVLCDRFSDATVVYQGVARGQDMGTIEALHRMILGDLSPDLTFLFDLPPEAGLERAWRQIREGGRTDRETRFEREALDFHQRVREGYLDLARRHPERFRIIDARRTEERVREEILNMLDRMGA